jgi:SAM-dependent methyltransferase
MTQKSTKEIATEVVEKYAARARKLSSVSVTHPSLASKSYVNPFLRKLNVLFKFFNLRCALSKYESTIYAFSLKQDDELYKGYDREDMMINIGSGAFSHPRWTNYDFPGQSDYYRKLQGQPNKDFIPIDLTLDLPLKLESESVSLIYCSHTIEHLPENIASDFLMECFRLLKKGGCLRLVFPNVVGDYQFAKICSTQSEISDATKTESIVAAAYNTFSPSSEYETSELIDLFHTEEYSFHKIPLALLNKDLLEGKFRPKNPDYHLSFWSHEKLLEICHKYGFRIYFPRQRGISAFKPFSNTCLFDTTEPQYSLYGELIK